MYTSKIYTKSPVWLQEGLISSSALVRKLLREGRAFKRELHDVLQTQWLSQDELGQFQLKKLQAMLVHAEKTVPYYREAFAKAGVSSGDIRQLSDIAKLPFLTKREVFDAQGGMLSETVKGSRFSGYTSGTTGLSMKGYRDLHAINRENAFVWRMLMWAGLKYGERRAWIRGDRIVPSEQTPPPFWRHNLADNMLMMSSYHLSESSAEAYVKAMEAFDPVMIQCYPNAILLLARFLKSANRKYRGTKLRSVATSSETVTDEHRKLVKEVFGASIFDYYSSFERVAAIAQCDHGNYHLLSDYSLVELLPLEEGGMEVVGTGFDNLLMPFIRFRLGDNIVMADANYHCPCNRAFPVVDHLTGRADDFIRTPDGREVIMMCNIFDGLDNLLEGQVIQDRLDELRVLVVPAKGRGGIDEADMVARAHELVGTGMHVKVEVVDEIPRTKNGKLRMVVRNI